MAAYDLQEQEQLAELKAWWKQYGNLVLGTITAALLVFAGWNGWTWYQRSQSMEAAAYYETLQKAARMGDAKAAGDAAGTLLEKYSGTAYAPLAALLSAKAHYQAGDLKTARAQLQWVIDKARQEEVQAIARLRLAAVLLDENAHDDALKLLEGKPVAGFEALFSAMRGDILLAQKKPADARSAYKAAIEKASEPALREALRLKLDALGDA
jgi:predicted negative regulator of RcsB-dependent stress response